MRPKKTPFSTVSLNPIQKKESTAGTAKSPQRVQFQNNDKPLPARQQPQVFSRPMLKIGRKRPDVEPVVENNGELSKRSTQIPQSRQVQRKITASKEPLKLQEPSKGLEKIMIRPNLLPRPKKKDSQPLNLQAPIEETSVQIKSPAFKQEYPMLRESFKAQKPEPKRYYEEPKFEQSRPAIAVKYDVVDVAQLDQRQVNINQEKARISQGKLQRQKQRAQELSRLINLELDSYEQTLNIGSITKYDSYINRIKGGYINNSLQQSFDDKIDAPVQTAILHFENFTQQCPQDRYKTYIGGSTEHGQKTQSASLYNFISRIAPVVEELLRPVKEFEMPPIFLLSLNPVFRFFDYCPYPVTLYKTPDYSIASIGQKLFVSSGQVTCLLSIGKYLLAGTSQGSIVLWAGSFSRGSVYDSVHSLLSQTDFQLPTFTTDSIEKQSYFKGNSSIKRLIAKAQSSTEFYSLEQFGKVVCWSIVSDKNASSELTFSLKPVSYISLTSMYSDNIVCYDIQKDPEGRLFVCTSKGIVKATIDKGQPQIYHTDSKCRHLYVTKKGNLMYALCQDNSIKIYDRSLSNSLLQLWVPTKTSLSGIIIPKIETESRELQILNQFYVWDSRGVAYRYNLMENKTQPVEIVSKTNSEDRNLKGSCVAIKENKLQFLFVNKELMTTSTTESVAINMDRSVANLKRIIEESKKFRQMLEECVYI